MLDIKIKNHNFVFYKQKREEFVDKRLTLQKKNDIKKNSQGQRKVPRPECWIYIKKKH